ncbi:MAG: lipopolysaccharide kinase InaA family protein [Candidatus Bathyarchaeia archaeon]|nr:hypothetical protein [Candidatus Bathyarchaeota archaeon]
MVQLDIEKLKLFTYASIGEYLADIFEASIYGPYAGEYADEKTSIDVLVIVESKESLLKCISKLFDSKRIRFLIVDRRSFERDVESEWLGGILTESILTPYISIINPDYIRYQEVKAKKRMVCDILNNLILSFPEMSMNFMIKPEYFMFETIMRRATLFPPIAYRFLNIARSDVKNRNYTLMMNGFEAALKDFISEGKLKLVDNEFLKISEEYIESIRAKRGRRLRNLFKNSRTRIVRYVLGIFPNIMDSILDDYRIYKTYLAEGNVFVNPVRKLENPRKYIFIPTSSGTVSFTERMSIEDFIRRHMPEKYALKHNIKRLGGVLNSVYILRVAENEKERKTVVKVFKDWYGWKWFPLTLWALGTRDFTVMGKARLEREYAINMFLSNHGINVPSIIYVSPEEKIIFQEYIDGINASEVIRQLYKMTGDENGREKLLDVIRRIGRELAKIHSLGVSVGDCKPENIILSSDGRIFFVDLEQAERSGDQAWDIAEFLYYSGHYTLLPSLNIIDEEVKEFIYGYLESGGKIENIKRALSPRYIKVFSFFTPPHVILAISNTCKRVLKMLTIEEPK